MLQRWNHCSSVNFLEEFFKSLNGPSIVDDTLLVDLIWNAPRGRKKKKTMCMLNNNIWSFGACDGTSDSLT